MKLSVCVAVKLLAWELKRGEKTQTSEQETLGEGNYKRACVKAWGGDGTAWPLQAQNLQNTQTHSKEWCTVEPRCEKNPQTHVDARYRQNEREAENSRWERGVESVKLAWFRDTTKACFILEWHHCLNAKKCSVKCNKKLSLSVEFKAPLRSGRGRGEGEGWGRREIMRSQQ